MINRPIISPNLPFRAAAFAVRNSAVLQSRINAAKL